MHLHRWTRRGGAGLVVGTVAASILGLAAPALAASGPVSTHPALGTPQLAPTGSNEQVRQLVQCGGTMYAVGKFTSIKQGSTTYSRNNAFSFSATAPYRSPPGTRTSTARSTPSRSMAPAAAMRTWAATSPRCTAPAPVTWPR